MQPSSDDCLQPTLAIPDSKHPSPVTQFEGSSVRGSEAITPPTLPGYTLLDELGRGGMGVVFKARQINANRLVALKMILAGRLASADEVARFRAEAEAAAGLDHPHIVPIYEVGDHLGQHFFAMKLVEGTTLDAVLPTLVKDNRAAATVLEKLARAVHYAHQRGVLHRDLKSANILIDAAGEPHVTDFGLARRLEGNSGLSRSGAIVGTPGYMSPEQAAARKDLTVAVDVYGLGAVLYELLTGRPPFKCDSPMETLLAVLEKEPVAPRQLAPSVDRDLETICLKCLQKEPEKRYGSAEALADDLKRFLAGEPILARRASRRERVWKWARRRPAVAALLATLLLVFLLGVAGVAWQWQEALAARTQAEEFADAETRERLKVVEASRKLQEAQVEIRKALVQTENERDAKNRLLQESISLRLAAEARGVADRDTTLSLLLGIEAVRRHPNAVSWSVLHRALDEAREERIIPRPGQARIQGATWIDNTNLRLLAMSYDAPPLIKEGNADWKGMQGPSSLFATVRLSPDGKRLVTVTDGHTVLLHDDNQEYLYTDRMAHVWDVATGKELARLHRHDSRITSVEFSPDGATILTASLDGTARLWDAATGKQKAIVRKGERSLVSATFSPSGRFILTTPGSQNRTGEYPDEQFKRPGSIDPPVVARSRPRKDPSPNSFGNFGLSSNLSLTVGNPSPGMVWNVETGESAALQISSKTTFQRLTPTRFTFNRDGRWLAMGTEEGKALVWHTASAGDNRYTVDVGRSIRSLALSPNAYLLALGCDDGNVLVWQIGAGREPQTLRAHRNSVSAVAFDPTGNLLVSTGSDSLKLWEVASGKEQAALLGHQGIVRDARFSADSQRLATVDGGTVRVWNLKGAPLERAAVQGESELIALEYASDGRLLVAERGGQVRVFPPGMGKPVLIGKDKHLFDLTVVRFFADGTKVVTASSVCDVTAGGKKVNDSAVHVWDAIKGSELLSLKDHVTGAADVRVSPDGRRMVTSSNGAALSKTVGFGTLDTQHSTEPRSGTLRMWSTDNGKLLWTIPGSFWDRAAPSFTPDGKALIVGATDGDRGSGIIDAETGKPLTGKQITGKRSTSIHSPDGRWLAVMDDGEPRVVETVTGKLQFRFKDLPSGTLLGGFSPDSRLLLTVSGAEVFVWDVDARRLLSIVELAQGKLTRWAFSKDGKLLALATSNDTITLAETPTGKVVFVFPARGTAVNLLAMSPDGKHIAAACGKRLLLWPVEPWPVIESRAPRQLTEVERVLFRLTDSPKEAKKRPEAIAP